MEIAEVEGFEAKPGNGLVATLAGDALAGGNLKFISAQAAVPAALRTAAEDARGGRQDAAVLQPRRPVDRHYRGRGRHQAG